MPSREIHTIDQYCVINQISFHLSPFLFLYILHFRIFSRTQAYNPTCIFLGIFSISDIYTTYCDHIIISAVTVTATARASSSPVKYGAKKNVQPSATQKKYHKYICGLHHVYACISHIPYMYLYVFIIYTKDNNVELHPPRAHIKTIEAIIHIICICMWWWWWLWH